MLMSITVEDDMDDGTLEANMHIMIVQMLRMVQNHIILIYNIHVINNHLYYTEETSSN